MEREGEVVRGRKERGRGRKEEGGRREGKGGEEGEGEIGRREIE